MRTLRLREVKGLPKIVQHGNSRSSKKHLRTLFQSTLFYQGAMTNGIAGTTDTPQSDTPIEELGCGRWPVKLEGQSFGCAFRQSRSVEFPPISPLRNLCPLIRSHI